MSDFKAKGRAALTASQLSLSLSEIEGFFYLNTQAELDRLRQDILTSRVLRDNPRVKKAPQIHLLGIWREGNVDQYRRKVRVDPSTFDGLLEKICGHSIFQNNSNVPQKPISTQLAIFLYRAGHYGNAASPEAIGHWAGVSPGTVVNCTNRVMLALLSLHDEAIHLPTLEEKESAKSWVADQVCPEWRNGHLMVDGTKFPLFQRPGLHGDTWFDKNKDYSLDCQVRSTALLQCFGANLVLACYTAGLPTHCRLRCGTHRQCSRFLVIPEHPHLQGARTHSWPWGVDMGGLRISIRDLVCLTIQEAHWRRVNPGSTDIQLPCISGMSNLYLRVIPSSHQL
jgi:hypothetical protein